MCVPFHQRFICRFLCMFFFACFSFIVDVTSLLVVNFYAFQVFQLFLFFFFVRRFSLPFFVPLTCILSHRACLRSRVLTFLPTYMYHLSPFQNPLTFVFVPLPPTFSQEPEQWRMQEHIVDMPVLQIQGEEIVKVVDVPVLVIDKSSKLNVLHTTKAIA